MPFEKGISIDLMPFDNVPNAYLSRRAHCFKCFTYRKILWSEAGKRCEKNILKRFIYKLLNLIPVSVVISGYENFIKDSNKEKTALVRILTFPTPKNVFGYERRWYEELSEYDFENLILPGAKDYDGYLTVKYGEYMKLPPKNKRKIHPVSKLILPANEEIGDEKI